MRLILSGLPWLVLAGLAAPLAKAQDANTLGTVVVTDEAPSPSADLPSGLHDEEPDEVELIGYEDRALDAVTRPELTLFAGESEFRRYLRRFEAIRRERNRHWIGSQAGGAPPLMAFQDSEQVEVCDDPQECPEPEEGRSIVVTGSMITPTRAPSITNVQTAGVDEGDIVKQIGDYLLVLQDGRIFSLNLRTMQRSDWIEAYRRNSEGDPVGADWYDEMLVQDDHILITAYSYEDSATELSVFKLDQASGQLSRLGVFLLSSDDYYSSDNYATRIIGDRLVMYAPYELEALQDRRRRPLIRRWQGPEEREDAQRRGRPLIDAQRLYWPVMRTAAPSIHTISICPLGEIERRDLNCQTTGFVGPETREMFVSPEAVYLWTSAAGEAEWWERPACAAGKEPAPRAAARDVAPGVVYRVPVNGSEPTLVPVRGMVFDQFGMDEFDGRFRGLAAWVSERCSSEVQGIDFSGEAGLALLDVPLRTFSTTYSEASERNFRAVPTAGTMFIENRFIDNWLVFGGRERWRSGPPNADKPQSNRVVAVPLGDPAQAQVFEPGHGHIRIERLGNNAVLNGYADDRGLHISMLMLGEAAQLGGHLVLDGRFESESRSHAFNATVNLDGSGIMGIPTVQRGENAERWWWRSQQSQISFIALDAAGGLADLGVLDGQSTENDKIARRVEGYTCEVSCVDWYGNTRPIFTLGRIFGLMETEVVEARVKDGTIRQLRRVDLTVPWPGRELPAPAAALVEPRNYLANPQLVGALPVAVDGGGPDDIGPIAGGFEQQD